MMRRRGSATRERERERERELLIGCFCHRNSPTVLLLVYNVINLRCDSIYTKMSKFPIPDPECSKDTVVRRTFPIGNIRAERV